MASPRLTAAGWNLATVVTLVLAALVPLLFNGNYYYSADTSQGTYGNWYFLGSALREGAWPLLNPSAWASGNYIAEGQFGLYSPLTALIAIGSTYAANVVVYASLVKIGLLVLGGLGVLHLLRSWNAPWALAFAGAVAAPLSGFTLYMDAPSWTTNLMIWAIFPWVWWGYRRLVVGRSPWLVLVSGYLMVSVGYVHGTLMLAVLTVAVLASTLVLGDRRASVRVLIAGGILALAAIPVYLPGVMTAEVTRRAELEIVNSGFMVADLTGLAASVTPTALPQISGWWGQYAPGPLLYTTWLLPLLILMDPRAVARRWRGGLVLAVVLVFSLLFVLGPSDVGPLRYPARLMPFVATGLIVAVILVLSHARTSRVTLPRAAVVGAAALTSGYLAFAQAPQAALAHAAATVGVLALLGGALLLLRDWPTSTIRLRQFAVLAAVGGLGVVTVQHVVYDGRAVSGANDYPADLEEYQSQAEGGVNDGIVIGDPATLPADTLFDETLVANTWYLNENVAMQNVYTTIFFDSYSTRMCMNHVGASCPELLPLLFEQQEGEPRLVDLLAIDTIQVINASGALDLLEGVPVGWSEVSANDVTTLWVRDEPVGPAGSVVWATGDVEFEVLSISPDAVEAVITRAGDGELVTSRLAWPGYTVSGPGARLGEPFDGFLLTADVSDVAVGETVSFVFRPPFWTAQVVVLLLVLGASGAWIVAHPILRRRVSKV